MNKIWILFKREYRTAVRTKSFIITLVLFPILMGGSFIVMMLMEDNKDLSDKNFAVIDQTGMLEEVLINANERRNKVEINDPETGEQAKPVYYLEFITYDVENSFQQKLEISDRVRSKEFHALIEIGKDILRPGENTEHDFIRYYSEQGFMDDHRHWFSNVINNYARQQRIEAMNLAPELTEGLFYWVNADAMGLVKVEKNTGEKKDAEKLTPLESIGVPYIIMMLMFMMTMMSAVPLLTAVMEEKNEKIAEVLLGTITPFEFMMGKVLGGVGVSLTTVSIYVAGGMLLAKNAGFASLIPPDLIVWFFAYIILFVVMTGTGMAALGATCNDNKDAQSIQFPAMLPIILPLFLIMPIIQNPTGSLATSLSFIPPFTPTIMMVRMATPVSIPLWQPLLGLGLVILFTWFTIWVGARIFRTAILIQGQKPSVKNLIKYAFKS